MICSPDNGVDRLRRHISMRAIACCGTEHRVLPAFLDDAIGVVTTNILYPNGSADGRQHDAALGLLDRLWREFDIVEIDETVVGRAARLAQLAALRGYDAVHCASAEQVQDDDLVFASGDRRLLAACAELGMMTADVNAEPVH